MSKLNEFKVEWNKCTPKEKLSLVEAHGIEVCKRGETSFSPYHPITRAPSRETFSTSQQAAVEQIEWLLSYID